MLLKSRVVERQTEFLHKKTRSVLAPGKGGVLKYQFVQALLITIARSVMRMKKFMSLMTIWLSEKFFVELFNCGVFMGFAHSTGGINLIDAGGALSAVI